MHACLLAKEVNLCPTLYPKFAVADIQHAEEKEERSRVVKVETPRSLISVRAIEKQMSSQEGSGNYYVHAERQRREES